MTDLNQQARNTLANLRRAFGTDVRCASDNHDWRGSVPIGIEVEVKWKDYFPGLWKRYLEGRRYSDLSPDEKSALTAECAVMEASLVPRLQRTVGCGLMRGADRYWEFAFAPATDVHLISDQVALLRAERLIPSGEHSLHVTFGGLGATRDAYYLLLLMEAMACSPQRIAAGFNTDNPAFSSAWATKGMGGLYVKEGRDLLHGYQRAVEMRTLHLGDDTDLAALLRAASRAADIIQAKRDGAATLEVGRWTAFTEHAAGVLALHGLDDTNWKKPSLAAEYWKRYSESYREIRFEVLRAHDSLLGRLGTTAALTQDGLRPRSDDNGAGMRRPLGAPG